MSLISFIISLLCTLAGVSGFIAFIILRNYPAAVLAIAAGILNLVLSHLHFLNYKKKLQDWYSPQHLQQICVFGFYSFALGISVLIYFSVVQIMESKPILPIHDSAIIPMVWAFITLKSGLILLCFARYYSTEDEGLLAEEVTDEASDPDVRIIINP